MHSIYEVIAAFAKRNIERIEAFILPLLRDLFVEVVSLRSQDEVRDLGLVKLVEEVYSPLVCVHFKCMD